VRLSPRGISVALVWMIAACDAPPESAPPPSLPEPDLAGVEPRVRLFLEDARRKVALDPVSQTAWGTYAMALDAHEMYDEASVAYREAHRLEPGEFRWPYLLARVIEVRGESAGTVQEAAELVRSALRLRPYYAPAHVRLGELEAQVGRTRPAEDAYRRAIELNPKLTKPHAALARILVADGRAAEARALLERVRDERLEDWEIETTLTRVYGALGERDLARAAAERAKALPQSDRFVDPVAAEPMSYGVSSTICFKRARVLAMAGQFEDAIQNLKVVVEVKPDYAPAQGRLGLCYAETGDVELAIRHLGRAIELEPDLAVERLTLARMLESAGDPSSAREHRERARVLDPGLFTADTSTATFVNASSTFDE